MALGLVKPTHPKAHRVGSILQRNVDGSDSDLGYTNIPVICSGSATVVAWSQTTILHVVFSIHGNGRDGAPSPYIVGNVVWRVFVVHALPRASCTQQATALLHGGRPSEVCRVLSPLPAGVLPDSHFRYMARRWQRWRHPLFCPGTGDGHWVGSGGGGGGDGGIAGWP
jgi:hypothetical protein